MPVDLIPSPPFRRLFPPAVEINRYHGGLCTLSLSLLCSRALHRASGVSLSSAFAASAQRPCACPGLRSAVTSDISIALPSEVTSDLAPVRASGSVPHPVQMCPRSCASATALALGVLLARHRLTRCARSACVAVASQSHLVAPYWRSSCAALLPPCTPRRRLALLRLLLGVLPSEI